MTRSDSCKNKPGKNIAIILAGGRGNRMKSDIPKQYMEVNGKPILYYSIKTFEDSFIDEIILVVGEGDEEYCRTNIVERFGFKKIKQIVTGGNERFNSVYNGISAIDMATTDMTTSDTATTDMATIDTAYINTDSDFDTPFDTNSYVFIHDGARPCVTEEILQRCRATVISTKACVAAMPVKDTIKIVDENGYAVSTPDRSKLWQIQTPQVFSYEVIKNAYDRLFASGTTEAVTDDAMVVEMYGDTPVKMVEGSYDNIKVTTPNDIDILKTYFM